MATEWDMFRVLDIATIKQLLYQPIVVDLRNLLVCCRRESRMSVSIADSSS